MEALKKFTRPHTGQLPVNALPHFAKYFDIEIPLDRLDEMIGQLAVDADQCVSCTDFVDFIMSNRTYVK